MDDLHLDFKIHNHKYSGLGRTLKKLYIYHNNNKVM